MHLCFMIIYNRNNSAISAIFGVFRRNRGMSLWYIIYCTQSRTQALHTNSIELYVIIGLYINIDLLYIEYSCETRYIVYFCQVPVVQNQRSLDYKKSGKKSNQTKTQALYTNFIAYTRHKFNRLYTLLGLYRFQLIIVILYKEYIQYMYRLYISNNVILNLCQVKCL